MPNLLIVHSPAEDWPNACRLVNFLLREGAEVRWATAPFRATGIDGRAEPYERGSFLVTDTSSLPEPRLDAARRRYQVAAQLVEDVSGFVGLPLRRLRIAMYGGGGAPFNHARIFAELGFDLGFISPQEIRAGKLADYDLFGMPGGGGLAMMGQLDPLGEDGCRRIKDWVQGGGMYIGSCAGSFNAALVSDSFLEVCPQQRQLQMVNAMIWNRGDTEWIGLESPGIGVIESRNLQPEHPIMFGVPDRFNITHYNGPIFETAANALSDASAAQGLSAVVGAAENFTPSERFLSHSETCDPAQTLLGRATREDCYNTVSGHNGLGRVVLFGSHPEFGENLMMDDWGQPARMLANAAFWQSGHLSVSRPIQVKREAGVANAFPPGSELREIGEACVRIGNLVEQLHGINDENMAWLAEDHAMSAFGMTGREIWHQGLSAFALLTERMHEAVARAESLHEQAASLESQETDEPDLDARLCYLREMTLALDDALHYETPAAWGQDFGYEGILQMLGRTEAMLQRACNNIDMDFAYSSNPYAYFDASPYQLVVGSYLAATGVYLNSWQLLQVHLHRIEEQIFATQIDVRA